MSQSKPTRKELLTKYGIRVLDLSAMLEWRGINPEHIEWTGDIDGDGKLAIDLDKIGARRSAEIECATEGNPDE